MLDDYKEGQPIAYNIMHNAIVNSKISHAYLFDTSGYFKSMDIVMAFVKSIICSFGFTNDSCCDNCDICHRIDEGNYLDVKVISSDGLWIKKEQLLDLQNEFSKESFEGNKRVYIIKDAEKMNVQTANSILKFLEEPNDNIIAILVTNDFNKILSTIVSRCQVIKLVKDSFLNSTLANFERLLIGSKYHFISFDEKEKLLNNIYDFITYYENNHLDTIIYAKSLWHNVFKDRDINVIVFDSLIYFYYDVLRYKNGQKLSFFVDKLDLIERVADKNEINDLLRKLGVLIECKDDVRKNLNMNLMIDKFIIEMCGD